MAKHVVVIGGGLGGLSAAIHARLQGHEVTVLEQGATVGGKAAQIERAGYRLDPGPSIIILTRIYADVFQRAGRQMDDYLQFTRLDPVSQVRFRGETLELPADREACFATVDAIDREDGRAFRSLFQKLDGVRRHIDASVFAHPYLKPWQLADPHLIATALPFDVRKTYRELVDGYFRSPLLRAFFYGFPSYGGQTYDSKAPGALMIPYLMIEEGVWYPVGGVSAIPKAFARLATELGVEIETETAVTGLGRGHDRITSVETSRGGNLDADAVISNVDRTTVGSWLGRPGSVRPSLSYFTLQWGLQKKPTDIRHHTLIIPEDFEKGFSDLYRHRKFPSPPIVYLNETSGIDPEVAPPGGGNLFAVVTSPACEPDIDWNSEAEGYRASVLETLRSAGIDVDSYDPVFERMQTPKYFAEAHGNHLGSLYGPDETERTFGGLFPLTNRDNQYKNLLYCGGSVQPGAGLPMVTLSGRFAAELIK